METVQSLAQHAALIQALCRTLADDADAPTQVVETHISSVLLSGASAYKIKKPVNLGFADFSTLALRRHFCEEEIRLNRRSAPRLYLDVVPVLGTLERPRLGRAHEPGALEYAVRMRRFDAQARLDQVALCGRLTARHIDRMAQVVAQFHARCAPAPPGHGYASIEEIRSWSQGNLSDLQAGPLPPAAAQPLGVLREWTAAELARRAAHVAQRPNLGQVRECHGDLHLGNLVLVGDTPVPFDCIEFNDRLRFIDVINDAAFAFMDLIEHGQGGFAWRFIDGYLQHTGDLYGLALLRFYAVYRALVRARIAQIRLQQAPGGAQQGADLMRYLDVALGLVKAPPRRLVLTCGLAGSGKSTVAQTLVECLGAVRVRSDVERKRLFGLEPGRHEVSGPGAGLYTPAIDERTYARLLEGAHRILQADTSAIVDATFLRRRDRERFCALAREAGVALAIVLCEAPPAVLRARVSDRLRRGADPSDATLEVLDHQMRVFEDPAPGEQAALIRIDTDVALQDLEHRSRALAAQLPAYERTSEAAP